MGDFLQLFWVRSNDRQSTGIRRPSNRFLAGHAFAHALRLAVAAKSHFYILHIECETEQADWVQFPRVRETLAAWGMIAPDAPRSAVASELGLRVEKAIIGSDDPARGVEAFVESHPCDLLVLMTHARSAPQAFVRCMTHGPTRRPTCLLGLPWEFDPRMKLNTG